MNARRGQVWTRRKEDLLEDDPQEDLHVTLACLGPGRFMSVNLRGEIHLWPPNGQGPDWNVWEPATEGMP